MVAHCGAPGQDFVSPGGELCGYLTQFGHACAEPIECPPMVAIYGIGLWLFFP